MVGYDQTKVDDKNGQNSFVHFFLDDYKFGAIWNDPEPRIQKLRSYKGVAVATIQHLLHYAKRNANIQHFPFAVVWGLFTGKWYNSYSNRFMGLPNSYIYCFDGIEKGSVVAVSTLGVKREKEFFFARLQ